VSSIEAIYQGGVFKPLGAVSLRENEKVRLSIHSLREEAVGAWLAEVQQFQQQLIARRGFFPDSTADIAADRMRDE
jgi:predicted DNA-binding antitoxin AbrB/MazE fold protein